MSYTSLQYRFVFCLLLFSAIFFQTAAAQQVTGVWKGRIGKQKAEVKIIQKGDSLTGTSYYYGLGSAYQRYSIKGYFDAETNSVVWWDDQLIEDKGNALLGSRSHDPLLSVADFNCPGSGRMFLEGKTALKEEQDNPKGVVELTKVPATSFTDEWDYVLKNYTIGANDPEIIDSVALIAFRQKPQQPPVQPAVVRTQPQPKKGMTAIPPPPQKPEEQTVVAKPLTIEEKFIARTPKYVMDIPLDGDSLELRFYDNAEIDGDSISLFLNQKLVFQHIRLSAKAHVVKLAVADLHDDNELVMVAENLGRIPPNTSYMVALIGNQRYEANLQSTEEISAMIRLKKPERGKSL